MVETSVPKLEANLSFECGSWDGPLNNSLVTLWKLMNNSCCPNPNAGLIWDDIWLLNLIKTESFGGRRVGWQV